MDALRRAGADVSTHNLQRGGPWTGSYSFIEQEEFFFQGFIVFQLKDETQPHCEKTSRSYYGLFCYDIRRSMPRDFTVLHVFVSIVSMLVVT
jgi:hypothetical protein